MRVLPTKWRRKAAGIDMERNYVTVTLCIAAVDDRLWNFVFHVPNVTSDANEITSSRPRLNNNRCSSHQQGNGAFHTPSLTPLARWTRLVSASETGRNQYNAAGALACAQQRGDVTRPCMAHYMYAPTLHMTSSIKPEVHNVSQRR